MIHFRILCNIMYVLPCVHILWTLQYTRRVVLRGQSSVGVICLKYGIIILIIIIISLGKSIIIVYFKHITHTVLIIAQNSRMGYVIIPKRNCSGRELSLSPF